MHEEIDEAVRSSLEASFQGLSLPLVSSLRLDACSLGREAPWIMSVEMLPTRSDQDLQLKCRLRWIASDDMVLKITAVTRIMSVAVSVKALEIEFPAWMQVVLLDICIV